MFDNSYTCLHFSDKMKVNILPENWREEIKVIYMKDNFDRDVTFKIIKFAMGTS